MEIGNEIGQKIRSAIRAKLVDLGAYVDDELPDYVMVMVANRKSEAQMCEDLSLFLGSNTSKFTSWLHGLLQKLLSITSEPSLSSEQTDETKGSGLLSSAAQHLSETAVASVAVEPNDGADVAEIQTNKSTRNRTNVSQKKRETVTRQRQDVALDEEPVIRLRLEHDEFEDETRGISEEVRPPSAQIRVKTETVRSVGKGDGGKKSSKENSGGNSNVADHGSQSQRKSSASDEGARGDGRKRARGLESSVGAVVKREVEEVDEAYDPLHPAIGSVASVVKVTERKSSVPPSLQANRTLLLLAMKDAEKSVAKFRRSSVDEIEATESTRGRTKTASNSTKSSSANRQESVQSASEPPVKEIPLTSFASRVLRDSRLCRKADSGDEENEKAVAVVRGRVIAVEAEKEPRQVESSGRNIILTDKGRNTPTVAEEDVSEEQQLRRILIQQQRLPIGRTSSPKFVVTLDGIFQNSASENSDALQLDEDEDEEMAVSRAVNVPRNLVRVKPQAQTVEEEEGANEEYEADASEFEPTSKKLKTAERCKFWPSCKNGDLCPFHHPSIPCKLFPSCRFGDKCLYLHPNCKFDGVCRNPACPYTHSVPHHPLTQPVPIIMPIRMPIFSFPSGPVFAPVRQKAPASTQHVRCRFFPNCTDMNCPFLHPKPCRYGLSCSSKNSCPFAHPQLPTKRQMKWVSNSAQRETL